jgi:hypothetical protein
VQQTSKGANQHVKSFYNTHQVWIMSYCECNMCWLEH